MNIVYFIKVILQKKWLILGCTLLAVGAAFLLTSKLKKEYSSTAEIATGFTMNDQVRLNDQGFDIYTIDLKFDNVIKTFTSSQVMSLLSYSLILHDLTTPQQAFRRPEAAPLSADEAKKAKDIFTQKLQKLQMLSSFSPEERKLVALLKVYGYDEVSLERMVNVFRLDRTDYIEITSTSENPLLSAYIVNNLCKEFNRFYNGYLTQRTEANVRLLDTALAQKKAFLDSQLSKLNTVLSGGDAAITDANMSLIKDYQARLTSRRSDLTSAELGLAQVNNQLEQYDKTQKLVFQNNTDILNLNKQISALQLQYENGGSKDNALADKIAALRKEVQDKMSKGSQVSLSDLPPKATLLQQQSDLKIKVQSAKADIASLQSSINSLTSNVRSGSSRDAISDAMQKEVDQARKDYMNAQEKYNIAINNNAEGSGFKQILIGQPAVDPLPSHRLIIVALAGAAAFFICIVVIIFLEYIDLSVKTPSFFKEQTDISVMNIVNRINLKKHSLLDILSKASSKIEKRQNTIRELIRKTRYSIEKTGHKILLFTSTEPGQGKTTLIQALAYSFSLSKKKVLVIDTNFCNNDLTVQVNARPTLENFSSTKPHLDAEDIEALVTHTATPGVDAIGCEGGDYTPREILPEGNALTYLRDLAAIYDYIFMEAAPMNEYSDTKELIEYADGVIAVFSSEAVIKQIDLEGIDYLKNLNGKFNGTILNKVEIENLER